MPEEKINQIIKNFKVKEEVAKLCVKRLEEVA
jgi:hypothetical protein